MKLRDYQEKISTEASECIRANGCAYLAMECRTGKTLTALVTAQKYGAKRVLFITKKKAMESVRRDYEALQKFTPSFAIEIINYESCHKSTFDPDFVICDEAHCMGAYPKPSKRTQQVKELCKGLPVLFLSGTPTPESFSQIYHQLWVCDKSPFAEFPNFYKWVKAGYVTVRQRKVNGYTINDYSDADKTMIDEEVDHLFFRYTQESAGFSCDIVERDLQCTMHPRTEAALKILKKRRVLEIEGKTILGDTPAKLMSKMHQLSGGTVISEDGTHIIYDRSKANYLRDFFKGRKIAIFYSFQSEFDLLKETFPNFTESPEEFQESEDKVFISQIRKAREGVRLDTADEIIFYSMEFSFLSYEQGRNRIVSKERKEPARVCFLTSDCGIENDILEAVRGKRDFTYSWYMKHNKRKSANFAPYGF